MKCKSINVVPKEEERIFFFQMVYMIFLFYSFDLQMQFLCRDVCVYSFLVSS